MSSSVPCSTNPPRVHDDHAVGDVGDDAEVVGDEDDPGAGLLAQGLASHRGSGPGSSRPVRSSARRRAAASASTTAPSRSSRAGACRRRTHAGRSAAVPWHAGSRPAPSSRPRGPSPGPCETFSWARICSTIWSPTRYTGSSELIGSWNTIAIPAPRIRCSCLGRRADQLGAVERRGPLELRVERRESSPSSVIAVTDLPEPDSPTIATTSPGSTVNVTPSTARTIPSSVANETFRSSTVSKRGARLGAHPSRIRGSSTAYTTSTTAASMHHRERGQDRRSP